MYTECNFKGKTTEVCSPLDKLDNPIVKGIYIPENFDKIVVLHKLPNFKG